MKNTKKAEPSGVGKTTLKGLSISQRTDSLPRAEKGGKFYCGLWPDKVSCMEGLFPGSHCLLGEGGERLH